jgi:DNA-binding NarL/FixJ family response regulator
MRPREARRRIATLTPHRQEIVRLMAQGKSVREIALQLGIDPATVGVHLSRIREKLNVTENMQVAFYALRAGLVKWDEVMP